MMPESPRVKALIEVLNRAISISHKAFTLTVNGPHHLTVAMKDGTYRKKPFIGGESLIWIGVREGKMGLILRFAPLTTHAEIADCYEATEKEAIVIFGDKQYRDVTESLLDTYDANIGTTIRDRLEDIKKGGIRAEQRNDGTSLKSDPNYGTW